MAVTKTFDKARKSGAHFTVSGQYVTRDDGTVAINVTGTLCIEYVSTTGEVDRRCWPLQEQLTSMEMGGLKKLLDDRFTARIAADGMTIT
ncbi:MAG: hypothetical protein M3P51_09105 [Chloroflexota bacterium]|nr:hypothetical protein [Chloroflexota bacterium]